MVATIALLSLYSTAKAQDNQTDNHTIGITVPKVALVDIESATSKNITLNFANITEAGEGLTAPTSNSDLWLNYSSILSGEDAAETRRKISVKLNAAIPGLDIKVAAATYAGSGKGNQGTAAASAITLTGEDQDLITNIGSCYTGNGVSNGHNLTYSVLPNDGNYGALVAKTNSVTVTYTISDN